MDNKQSVNILIDKRIISSSDDKAEKSEFYTRGTGFMKNGVYYFMYNESEVSGLEGTKTTIKVKDNIVSIIRTGSVNSMLVFSGGGTDCSSYETQYGNFDVTIHTQSVLADIEDYTGQISIKYAIEISKMNEIQRVEINIKIRKAEIRE